MGKLEFYYGTMASAKSANLLMTCHQYMDCGTQCILLKSSLDTRNETGFIYSRAVEPKPCLLVHPETNIFELVKPLIKHASSYICIFVDEAHFLKPEHINQLWELSRLEDFHIDVKCYGLKTSYTNELFKTSSRLLILADSIHCLPSMCSFCHNEATTHLRIVDGVPVKKGPVYMVGDVEKSEGYYRSVCQSCYKKPPKKL